VVSIDAAGNISGNTDVTFVVDSVAPAAPTFAGASPADGATLNAGDGNVVSYTWSFEAGTTLNYNLAGPTPVSGSLPDAGGDGVETFTTPALADGAYTMTVDVSDAAGNTSPQTVRAFTLDTVAPADPVITAGPPAIGNNNTVTFTVTGEPFATFDSVYSTGGPPAAGPTATDSGGTGSVDITLPGLADNPNYLFSVRQTDQAGNQSSGVATYSFAIDTTAPNPIATILVPDLVGTAPDQATYTPTPTFSWNGSGEAGATWEYTTAYTGDPGTTTWSGPIATESVTLGPLAVANDYVFAVREIDAAGNIGTVALSITFDVFSSGSSTITINNPGVPTFSMDTGPFTLDVGGNAGTQTQIISITTGETLDAQTWFINGTQVGTAATYTVDAGTDPALVAPLVYGTNTLTLVVEIGGLPYSDDFLFTVEDN